MVIFCPILLCPVLTELLFGSLMPRITVHLHPLYAPCRCDPACYGPGGDADAWAFDFAGFTRFMVSFDGLEAAPDALSHRALSAPPQSGTVAEPKRYWGLLRDVMDFRPLPIPVTDFVADVGSVAVLLASPRFGLEAILCLTSRVSTPLDPLAGHRIGLVWAGRNGQGRTMFETFTRRGRFGSLAREVWDLPYLAPRH